MKMRYRATQIPILKDRVVFFDANVLIYIFWPTIPNSTTEIDYGSILSNLLKNSISLAINETVISEIVNRVLRIEFSKTGLTTDCFKEYRNSIDGEKVQEDIYSIINTHILTKFQIINEPLNKNDIESFLVVSGLDFNDKIIEHICTNKNYVLLTHDKDFASSSADILSANPDVLLRK